MKHHYTYLALGDSYTIGESVALHDSFPCQVVQLLRNKGVLVSGPEIVAKTGWTSFELAEHLLHTQLNDHYDFVTLLIGVNNQYRELPLTDFAEDFDFLLKKAIHLVGEKSGHVIVLSIPDWGVTPFALKRGASRVSEAIDKFNTVCEAAAKKAGARFIDITGDSREAKSDMLLLAADHLHYSGKEHAIWASKTADMILSMINS